MTLTSEALAEIERKAVASTIGITDKLIDIARVAGDETKHQPGSVTWIRAALIAVLKEIEPC